MAALAADTPREWMDVGQYKDYPVNALSQIYKGSLVSADATGNAIASADTAGTTFLGIATENALGGASDGDTWIRVEMGRAVKLVCTSITQAMVGDSMFVVDSGTVDDAAGATNDILVGVLVEYVSATSGWVFVGLGSTIIPVAGVTASSAELNLLDGTTAGTVVASKALAVGATKNLDTLVIADGGLYLGAGAGTSVTSTAAELNILDGALTTYGELNKLDESTATGCGFLYASGTISSAELLALRATQIELVATPGVGLALVPYMFTCFLDHGGTDYVQTAGADHMALMYNGGVEIAEVGSEAQCTALLEAGADAQFAWPMILGWIPTANKGIELDNNGGNEWTTGDGVLDWYLIYAIVPVA